MRLVEDDRDFVATLPSYAVIIRAIWERGTNQRLALAELASRGLWLTPEQKAQANIGEGCAMDAYISKAIGTLAYFDSFGGLVPCRIVRVVETSCHQTAVFVKLTASRGPYARNETVQTSISRVVPRSSIRRRKYTTIIMPYSWKEEVGS